MLRQTFWSPNHGIWRLPTGRSCLWRFSHSRWPIGRMVGVITKRFSDWTDQSRFNNPQFFMGMEVSTFQMVSPCIQLVDSSIAWIFKPLDSLTCQTVDRARPCLNCHRYWCCKRYDVACPHPATNSETLELDTFVSCFSWPTAVFSGSLRLWCWIRSVGKRMVKWQEGEMIPGQSKIGNYNLSRMWEVENLQTVRIFSRKMRWDANRW